MQCPKCSRELFEVDQDLVTLDCCPGCKGLWFDRGELEKITKMTDLRAKLHQGTATRLSCPRCHNVLNTHGTSEDIGVDVELCEGCGGVWLDAAELDAFRKRRRPRPEPRVPATRRRPSKRERPLTLKELLLNFIGSSMESLS